MYNCQYFRGRNSSLVVCWARCPWCSVAGTIFFWRDFFSVEGFFLLELTWFLTPFSKNSFGWEYKLRPSLRTHAFHGTDSKDPDIHVLGGWMPATKTHPACTIHEDRMWLPLGLDKETVTYAKISTKWWTTRKKAGERRRSQHFRGNTLFLSFCWMYKLHCSCFDSEKSVTVSLFAVVSWVIRGWVQTG